MNNNNNQKSKSKSKCDNCNSDEQLILHNIIKLPKSPPQKLCNSCVLSHFHKSFCAQCFQPYDSVTLSAPPTPSTTAAAAMATGNNRLLNCMRCDSWSHFGCPRANVPKSPYICPRCMSANYKYFNFGRSNCAAVDKEAAKQLLGAARMAAVTVGKAAAAVKVEAERRAKEAALARKRASEAIDHVVAVAVKVETVKRKETVIVTPPIMVTPPVVKAVNYAPVRLDGGEIEVKTGGNSTNGAVTGQHCDDKAGVVVSNGNVGETEVKNDGNSKTT